MPELPIITNEFIRWLEWTVAPAVTPPDEPRNPGAPTVAQFGQTIASKARGGTPSNKVFCFGPEDLSLLDEILAFYAVDNLEPSFYLTPPRFTAEVAAALIDRGFSQRAFSQAILYGLPLQEATPPAPGVTVERVTADTLEEFVLTTADGFEWHEAWRDNAMAGVRRSFRAEDYHFLAHYEGKPAGVGSFGMRDGLANLGGGAVTPALRNHGCHTALVHHRLHLAHTLGCTLVKGGAFFGTGSFRNQQRAGMRLAYIESGWSRQ